LSSREVALGDGAVAWSEVPVRRGRLHDLAQALAPRRGMWLGRLR
jgi:hypothetical protein